MDAPAINWMRMLNRGEGGVVFGDFEIGVEFLAKTVGDRVYALLGFAALGLVLAILGRAGVTLKGGKEIKITIVHKGATTR